VALTATGGTITLSPSVGVAVANIFADNLRLESSTGIGALAGSPIASETVTLAAVTDSAVSGDIDLVQPIAATIGATPVFSVNQVGANGTLTATSTTTLTGITTTAGSAGSIVVQTTAGALTVASAVSAGGIGNILLDAAASNLAVSAGVTAATGNVTLLGDLNVAFTAAGDVTVSGAGGTVLVSAQGGNLTQGAGDAVQTDGANIILTATGNIVVGVVDARVNSDRSPAGTANQALWGEVELLSGGTITNAQTRPATATNLYASALRLEASTGIGVLGASNNPIVTEVAQVAAVTDSSASGDINLLETTTAEQISTLASFSVSEVVAGGATTPLSTATLAGVSTTGASTGSIVLATTNAAITVLSPVLATGSGNLLIDAQGAGSNVSGQANITSVTGNLTIVAANSVLLTAGGVTVTGAGGTIDVVAQSGAINQGAALVAQTDGANISFTAATGIILGTVDARVASDQGGTLTHQSAWGNVALTTTGGTITLAGTASPTAPNVFASSARLESATGIGIVGAGAYPIVIEVIKAAAVTDSAVSGDIFLGDPTALTVGAVAAFSVNQVGTSGAITTSTTTALAGVATTTGSSGSIILLTAAGSITVPSAVSAGGAGNVLISANGTGSSVAASAPISSVTGDLTISAADNLAFSGTGNLIVSGGPGSIALEAQAGSITQGATNYAQTDGGNVAFQAATTLSLGLVDARVNSDRTSSPPANQSSWGTVGLFAQGGAITNAQAQPASVTNIYASGAILEATTGIGTLGLGASNPIITEVSTIAAETSTSGGINILQQIAVDVDAVPAFTLQVVGQNGVAAPYTVSGLSDLTTAGNGSIVLVTNNGSITLNAAVNPSAVAASAAGTGNVLIEAQGATSDLTLNSTIDTGTGDVTLSAGRNVLLGSAVGVTAAGNLDVAATGSVVMAANNVLSSPSGVEISAGVNIALGQVSSAANVWITAAGSVTDSGAGTITDVMAANAVIDDGPSTAGVGTAAAPIRTVVTTLTALGGTGGVYVTQTGATTVGPVSFAILSVNADGTTTSTTVTQNGVTTGTGGGAISLVTVGGGLTINGNLSSPAGVTVRSAGTVQENFAITDAGTFAITSSSAITMASSSSITATGAILDSTGNIQVSAIATGTGPIAITGGAALSNVLGSSGGTNLTGGAATITTVGSQGTPTDTLNTALSSLSSTVTGTGSIAVAQTGSLALAQATTANGLIQVSASGNLTAASVSGTGGAGVTLAATSGNLLVGSVTADGAVAASASAQINQQASGATANVTAPQLTLTAGTGIGISSTFVVAVPLLAASSTSGNINLQNLLTTAVTVSNLSTGTGNINYNQTGGTATVTSATTSNGSINLGLTNGNLLVQNAAAGGTGSVTLNVTGTGQIQYTTISAGSGNVNLTTAGSATITQDIVSNGNNVNLSGAITLSRNTAITTNGGAVTFTNSVTGPYSLTINAGAGAVDFAQAVGAGTGDALTALTVSTTSSITFGQTLAVAGNISLTSAGLNLTGGAGSVATTNGGQFIVQAPGNTGTIGVGSVSSPSSYGTVLTTTDIAALAPGFSEIVIGSGSNTARVDVGTAAFISPTLIQSAVAVQVLAGQTLAISGTNALSLTGGAGDTGLVTMLAGSAIAAGSGTITLTADELNLASSAGSITGTGTLVLEPLTLSRPIVVGQAGTSGQFALTLGELAVPATTLSVTIGAAQGSGPINVYAVNFDTPVNFQAGAASGSLNFNANVSTTLANDGISAAIGGTITIAGNLVVAVSGSISLVAASSGNGVGNIVIAPTANEVLHTVSGNINLTGQNLTFGTFSLWTQLISSGSVNLTVGATGGTLQINDIYSEIKANTNVTIASGSATASTTGQLEIEGQVQAVGTITVTSNSSINLDNSSLVALGNILMQSTGNIQLSAGNINSQKGTVTITANSGQNGSGTLSLAGISPLLINGAGNVNLTGENVVVGNSVAFARVITPANLNIFADYYAPSQGTVTVNNAGTQLQVGNIQFGSATYAAGTPYAINFTGGTITDSGTFSLYALGNVTSASTNFNSTGVFSLSADDNITINSGSILTGGAALTLLADASTGQQGVLTLASGASISDPTSTVTLSGYTVTNNALVTDLHLTITPGH